MKTAAPLTALLAVAHAASVAQRQDETVWAISAFEATAGAAAGASTVAFHIDANYPAASIACESSSAGSASIAPVVKAPCGDVGPPFNFNLTSTDSGDYQLVVEWRFTGHGGYAGKYSIPAAQVQVAADNSQIYTGPSSFSITDFFNVYY